MEKEKRINLHAVYKKAGHSPATKFLLPSLSLPNSLISYDNLKVCGFIDIMLLDKTKGKPLYFPNSLGMIFNPSTSFHQEKWQLLEDLLKSRPNFVELIEYGGLVFNFWMSIDPKLGKNVRYYFRHGLYSELPKKLVKEMNDTEKKICNMDEGFKANLAFKLGLDIEELTGIELASIPDKEEYTIDLSKY